MKTSLSKRRKKKKCTDAFSPDLTYDPGILGENGAAVLKARFRFPRLHRARLSTSAPLAAQAAVHPQGFCCEPLHTTRCRSDCFLHCSNNGAGLWQARSIGEKVTPYTQQTPDIIRTSSPCKSRWDRISLSRVKIKESGPPRGRLLRATNMPLLSISLVIPNHVSKGTKRTKKTLEDRCQAKRKAIEALNEKNPRHNVEQRTNSSVSTWWERTLFKKSIGCIKSDQDAGERGDHFAKTTATCDCLFAHARHVDSCLQDPNYSSHVWYLATA